MMEKIFVGIDISKEKLDVFLRPKGDFFQVKNDEEGIKELFERLSKLPVACIVMEASDGYERLVFALLSQEGFPCSLVNAKKIREFAKSTGKLAKNDKVDAKVFAHFGEAIESKVTSLPEGKKQVLRELFERREQTLKMKVAEKKRLGQKRERRGEVFKVLFVIGSDKVQSEIKVSKGWLVMGRRRRW